MRRFVSARLIAIAVVSLVGVGLAIGLYVWRVAARSAPPKDVQGSSVAAPADIDEQVPPRRSPSPSPSPSPKPPPKPAPPKRVVNVDVYRGLGAWVDIYDDNLDPSVAVDEMARRGVKTLYLETNNWHSRGEPGRCVYGPDVDILYPDKVTEYVDRAHAKGLAVVAWYVPGFADMDRDVRRTMAAINFVTRAGNHFDGYAADIESRGEFGCKGITGDEQRIRFNSGIIEYSKRLRAETGAEKILGAIVVDAKNNEKAPARWEGFPWREIGQQYDVVMPMAYWHAAKVNGEGKLDCSIQIDTGKYIGEVVSKTQKLMGTTKPMHLIGGVARMPDLTGTTRDCISVPETGGYVAAAKAAASLGVSVYDVSTMQEHSSPEGLWGELAKFSG